jgi:NAD(P)-dependent dehydrogenase (short-subunit alcohol dehydrogenase family)
VDKLFEQIRRVFGRLDVLVNNAGISPKKPFKKTEEKDWDRIFATNLKSVFLCCKQALSLMPAGGAVLNISSIHANVTTYNFSAYAASKAGMEALTRNLAIEFGEKNIRVNALRVGWIVTEREPFGTSDPSYEAVCARIPMCRVGQWWCGDHAQYALCKGFC